MKKFVANTLYTYNAIGRRVGGYRGSDTEYFPDTTSALPVDLMVYDSIGTERKNVYAVGSLVAQITETPSAAADGVEPGLYAHTDILGSLSYLTRPDGSGYAAFDYGPWGDIDPTQCLDAVYGIALAASYTGHGYDAVLEVWFAQARLYDAGDRRFTAVDPIEWI